MKDEDLKHIVVAVIAIAALILGGISLFTQKEGETVVRVNNPPTAEINVANTTVMEMDTVNFDGSGSTDTDGAIVEYTWNFGDGVKDSGMYSTHFYTSVGTYTVTLTVVDNKGASDVDSVTMTVIEGDGAPGNEPPTAVINVDTTTVEVWSLITFNGSGSVDTDGTIIEYTWDFDDGSKDSGMYSSHYFSAVGTYDVTLTVVDDEGASDVDSVIITVIAGSGTPENTPPIAVINANMTTIESGQSINFNGSESIDPDGTIVEYTWDFDDGAKDSGMHTSHIYQTEGTYNVTLTVIDDDGATDIANITIIVQPPPPTTPKFSMIWQEDIDHIGNWTGNILEKTSGDWPALEDCIVNFTHGGVSKSKTLEYIKNQGAAGWDFNNDGDLIIKFFDNDGNNVLGLLDQFILIRVDNDDVIKLIYEPTSEEMHSRTF